MSKVRIDFDKGTAEDLDTIRLKQIKNLTGALQDLVIWSKQCAKESWKAKSMYVEYKTKKKPTQNEYQIQLTFMLHTMVCSKLGHTYTLNPNRCDVCEIEQTPYKSKEN